ncbi:MAG: cyclic nucleotide-binding domain-containing protein [Alphaproteobacteria bacterium]|nr:cyclic nucleotide-binding domain-containing protein [Alphaproteobacteria bacterium]
MTRYRRIAPVDETSCATRYAAARTGAGSGARTRRRAASDPRAALALACRSPILAALPDSERDTLLRLANIRSLPAKTMILCEGARPEGLYIVLDGLMQLCTIRHGRPVTIVMLPPGSCFAASALLRDEPMLTSAQALRNSVVAEIPAAEFLRMTLALEPLAYGMLQDFAISYRNALRELKTMRLPNKLERLISWILTMHREVWPSDEIALPFGKAQLAARLGIEPATLSRMFARLGEHGVEVRGRILKVRDIAALRRFGAQERLTEAPVP